VGNILRGLVVSYAHIFASETRRIDEKVRRYICKEMHSESYNVNIAKRILKELAQQVINSFMQ